jgi:hypothetical protein
LWSDYADSDYGMSPAAFRKMFLGIDPRATDDAINGAFADGDQDYNGHLGFDEFRRLYNLAQNGGSD